MLRIQITALAARYHHILPVVLVDNVGVGVFGGGVAIPVLQPSSVSVADLDGDGDIDLLTTSTGDNRVQYHKNNGGGTFGGPRVIASLYYPVDAAAADLDGDGDADVVFASFQRDEISWSANLGGASSVRCSRSPPLRTVSSRSVQRTSTAMATPMCWLSFGGVRWWCGSRISVAVPSARRAP